MEKNVVTIRADVIFKATNKGFTTKQPTMDIFGSRFDEEAQTYVLIYQISMMQNSMGCHIFYAATSGNNTDAICAKQDHC